MAESGRRGADPEPRHGTALNHFTQVMVALVAITVLLAGCSDDEPATDNELKSLAATYGRTVELTRGPVDRTDSLGDSAAAKGLIGQVTAQTRHGRVLFQRYASWRTRC